MREETEIIVAGLVDLAGERLGGRALAASDEFFAPKENLLRAGPARFDPERYTERGKWMDGWETRRRRGAGHDWCLLRLGLAGRVEILEIDTSHFLGNSPSYASLESCQADPEAAAEELGGWVEILQRSPLRPGTRNLFSPRARPRSSHLRLHIYPDGGVARLRAWGRVLPDWEALGRAAEIDLVALASGGRAVASSDMFFGSMANLILPGRARDMSEGWETRRRRGEGHDWVILAAGRPGSIGRLEIDTSHFLGNAPARCSAEVSFSPERDLDGCNAGSVEWQEILPPTPLEPDRVHQFQEELQASGPFTHLRLHIYPDGGLARVRAWGTLEEEA